MNKKQILNIDIDIYSNNNISIKDKEDLIYYIEQYLKDKGNSIIAIESMLFTKEGYNNHQANDYVDVDEDIVGEEFTSYDVDDYLDEDVEDDL